MPPISSSVMARGRRAIISFILSIGRPWFGDRLRVSRTCLIGGVAGGDPGERDTLTLRKLRTLEACDDLAL